MQSVPITGRRAAIEYLYGTTGSLRAFLEDELRRRLFDGSEVRDVVLRYVDSTYRLALRLTPEAGASHEGDEPERWRARDSAPVWTPAERGVGRGFQKCADAGIDAAMSSAATPLRAALKERFYPFAAERGFVRGKSKHPLFTVFRRQHDRTVHVFDIQWDKYGTPRFVLNFGEAPVEGVDVQGMHIDASDIEPWHCEVRGRLQRRKGGSLGCWFQLRKPLLKAITSGAWHFTPSEVVDQVIQSFSELEAWWATKAEGPHIYVVPEPRR